MIFIGYIRYYCTSRPLTDVHYYKIILQRKTLSTDLSVMSLFSSPSHLFLEMSLMGQRVWTILKLSGSKCVGIKSINNKNCQIAFQDESICLTILPAANVIKIKQQQQQQKSLSI